MKDLPPVFLHVGEDEVLLDDARRYATQLESTGGSVDLHIWQGMVHVFPANFALLRAATEALEQIGRFLRMHLTETRRGKPLACYSHHQQGRSAPFLSRFAIPMR